MKFLAPARIGMALALDNMLEPLLQTAPVPRSKPKTRDRSKVKTGRAQRIKTRKR